MTFKKRVTKSIALALVGVTIATPILNTSYAYSQNINTIKEDSFKGIENDIYAEKEIETINIDGINYTYKYYYKNGNRVINITNDSNDDIEELVFNNSDSTIYINEEAVATMGTVEHQSNESSLLRAYYVWETKSKSTSYISWIKGVSVGALAAIIASEILGGVGASVVIARIGSTALGVFAASSAGGTVYNTLQMYQAPFTTPQYRTLWGFKAPTGDYYGDYIYHW